jgi:hypothetical protein
MSFDARSERALPLPACGERGTLDLLRVGERDLNFFNIAYRIELSTRGESPSPYLAPPKLGAGAERSDKNPKAFGLRTRPLPASGER